MSFIITPLLQLRLLPGVKIVTNDFQVSPNGFCCLASFSIPLKKLKGAKICLAIISYQSLTSPLLTKRLSP